MSLDIHSISYKPSSKLAVKKHKQYVKWYESTQRLEVFVSKHKKVSNAPPLFIVELLRMIQAAETKKTPYKADEALHLLQVFAVSCECPRLFFTKKLPSHTQEQEQETSSATDDKSQKEQRTKFSYLNEYKFILEKFYQKLQKSMQRYFLCQQYIYRGTRGIRQPFVESSKENSSGQTRKLYHEAQESLAEDVQQCYDYYFNTLEALGYSIACHPTVDSPLLEHCIEKDWLLPYAHIILLRDAQYQSMGKRKYKKEELVDGSGVKFQLGLKTCAQNYTMKSIASLSYEVAQGIQKVLIHHLSPNFNITITSNILLSLREKESREFTESTSLRFLLPVIFPWRTPTSVARARHWSSKAFAVPDCNPDLLALRIGKRMDFTIEQVDALRELLPKILWRDSNILEQLNNIPAFQSGSIEKEKLEKVLRAAKRFLEPSLYYGYKTDKNSIPQIGKDAAKDLINNGIFEPSYDNTANSSADSSKDYDFLKIVTKLVIPRNITDDLMLISHALETEDRFLLPRFIHYYRSRFHKSIQYYGKSKTILRALNLNKDENFPNNYEVLLKFDPSFERFMEDAERLDWPSAQRILKEYLCSTKGQKNYTQRIKDYIQRTYHKELGYWKRHQLEKDQKMQNLVYYWIFLCLVRSSLDLLEQHMIDAMIKLYNISMKQHYESLYNKTSAEEATTTSAEQPSV